jgi:hypothetical protein
MPSGAAAPAHCRVSNLWRGSIDACVLPAGVSVSLLPSLSHCQRQSACARFSRIRCALTLTRIDSSESEYIEIDPGESEYIWIDPGGGSIAAQNRSPGPQAIVRAREHSPRGSAAMEAEKEEDARQVRRTMHCSVLHPDSLLKGVTGCQASGTSPGRQTSPPPLQ